MGLPSGPKGSLGEREAARAVRLSAVGYRLAAEAVLVVHLSFIVFVVVGGFLTWRWAWVRRAHVPAVAWGGLVTAAPIGCPLTPLEKWLRRRAGGRPYEGGFAEHYLVKTLYPAGLTTFVQIILAAGLILVTTVAYRGYSRRSRQGAQTR